MRKLYVAIAAVAFAITMAATMALSSTATGGYLFLGGGGS